MIAVAAGIDPAALQRWCRGRPTVAPAHIPKLREALGLLPEGPLLPNPDLVHVWQPRRKCTEDEVGLALETFYSNGLPEVAEAAWSRLGRARMKKFATLDMRPELYAFYDGRVMVVFRPGPGIGIFAERLGCPWRGGSRDGEAATLSANALKLLLKPAPTPEDFQTAWLDMPGVPKSGGPSESSAGPEELRLQRQYYDDLKALGISPRQALEFLKDVVGLGLSLADALKKLKKIKGLNG